MTTVVIGGVQEIIAQVMLQKKKESSENCVSGLLCGCVDLLGLKLEENYLGNSILFAQSYWMTVHVADAE